MKENSFLQQPSQEKLAIKVEIATEKDWEAYKQLKLMAITGKDKKMLGISSGQIKREQNRTEKEWRQDFYGENKVVVLAKNDFEVVGMGLARKRQEDGTWHMFFGYVRENFRNRGIGQRMFASRLNEIRKRGGKRVTIAVEDKNIISIHLAESFGFKKDVGFFMRLEDVNDPIVVKKINEVLNAG